MIIICKLDNRTDRIRSEDRDNLHAKQTNRWKINMIAPDRIRTDRYVCQRFFDRYFLITVAIVIVLMVMSKQETVLRFQVKKRWQYSVKYRSEVDSELWTYWQFYVCIYSIFLERIKLSSVNSGQLIPIPLFLLPNLTWWKIFSSWNLWSHTLIIFSTTKLNVLISSQ